MKYCPRCEGKLELCVGLPVDLVEQGVREWVEGENCSLIYRCSHCERSFHVNDSGSIYEEN